MEQELRELWRQRREGEAPEEWIERMKKRLERGLTMNSIKRSLAPDNPYYRSSY